MELDHLEVIDWDLALRLAGNKEDLAQDMLNLVIKSLPAELALIQSHHAAQNFPLLIHHIHKLHGALCYTGLPRLKMLLERLESDLKNHIMDSSSSLLHQLDCEIRFILERFTLHTNRPQWSMS